MQLISKKNYISIVCIVFTLISLSKIILETISGYKDPHYAENFIIIFLISLIAILVLGLHYYLQMVPLTIVILGQYIFLLGIIMLGIWIDSHIQKMAPTAYKDIFMTFTVPYVIGAIIYYVTILLQMRKANRTLEEIKKDGGMKDEN